MKAARERQSLNYGNSGKAKSHRGDAEKNLLTTEDTEEHRGGLRLPKEREELKGLRLAELRKEIALGAREADRGKFVDGARTFADIRRKSKRRKTSGR
jgi:hypothetical protein